MHPDAIEYSLDIIYNNKRYSWQQIKSTLDRISRQLDRLSAVENIAGNEHRSLAIISQDRLSVTLFLLHAFFKKSCVYPVSPSQSSAYVNSLLIQSKVKRVITDKSLEITVKQLPLYHCSVNAMLSGCLNAIHSQYTLNVSELESSNESALLITTSGSLSAPKIVCLSYRNIFQHVYSFTQRIPLTSRSLWLNCLPLEHIAGAMILYRCLLANASMLINNDFNEEKVWQAINACPVSHISLVPLMLKRILDHAGSAPPPVSLKYVLVGGDHIPAVLLKRAKRLGWPIVISYGMTEACSTIALGETPDKLQLLPGIQKHINSKGELQIKGPMVMSGYMNSGPAKGNGLKDNWFNTHDLVFCQGHFMQYSGRSDNRIISGGETHDPQLLEELLRECPGAADLAVGKINHAEWGHSVVVIVRGNAEHLKSWADEHLDKKYRPRFYIETDVIPRNPLGKINRPEVQGLIKQMLE